MRKDGNLFDLTVRELLEKFGAGSHKPGSGSAAAFQGILAIELLKTVISITTSDRHKKKYEDHLSQHLENLELLNRYAKELEELFHEDALVFDKAIKARETRNQEPNALKKHLLARDAIEALEQCCSIPFKIAEIAFRVHKIGLFTFENGFKSARGDSAVGIRTAISTMEGAKSILDLNLQDCIHEEWAKAYISRVEKLGKAIVDIRLKADQTTAVLSKTLFAKQAKRNKVIKCIKPAKESPHSRRTVEKVITELVGLTQKNQKDSDCTADEINLNSIAKSLGYKLIEQDLGDQISSTGSYRIGGSIDPNMRLIQVNDQLSPEQQRFTFAHELGHAVLHPGIAAHRDIPIDHERASTSRVPIERQADQFAALLLMPRDKLIVQFQARFGPNPLRLDESSAGLLGLGSIGEARKKAADTRRFARVVAAANLFGPQPFPSLAQDFKVSVEAMAIRLEELRLVIL